jgi:hypothetical protein
VDPTPLPKSRFFSQESVARAGNAAVFHYSGIGNGSTVVSDKSVVMYKNGMEPQKAVAYLKHGGVPRPFHSNQR